MAFDLPIMAGLRPRSLHTRSQSSIQGSTSTIDSIKEDGFVARPHQRPRSQSHHPSVSATKFADRHPLQGTLREYLLGKIELAEEGVKELEGMVVDEDHTTSYGSGSGSSSSSDGYAEDEWEVVSRKSKSRSSKRSSPTPSIPIKSTRSLLSPRPSKATASNLAPPSTSSVDQDTTLQQFLNAATNFLTAIKSELPTLSNSTSTSTSSSSSPLIHFQLSPQARKDLDKFLDDHPLPSVPGFKELTLLKACLDDSKRSCLSRLTIELNGLQQVLSGLANNVEAPTPLHSLHLMREYFTNESDRLAQTLSSISSTTSSNLIDAAHILSAGANRVVDEATTLLATSSTAAFDEAARIYHAALEGGRIRLLSYEELPHQWKNNQHILSGYRFIGIDRWGAILKSAFQFHNETINIHSHFLGFLSLIYLSIFILPYSPAFSGGNHWGDKAIVLLFIGAGMKCLLCSTAWHLLSGCATGGWHRGAACVDYVGISGLIAASVMGMEVSLSIIQIILS